MDPGSSVIVLVPLASTGEINASNAGKVSSVPPPATAFITPAAKAETLRNRYCRNRGDKSFQGTKTFPGHASACVGARKLRKMPQAVCAWESAARPISLLLASFTSGLWRAKRYSGVPV